jgi:hypothetical protein
MGRHGRHDLRGAPVGVRHHRRQLVLEASVKVPLVALTSDQTVVGKAGEGVRDRWPLGPDELAEQLVGKWQRQPDATPLDLSPATRQVPEEQGEADLEAWLGGDRALDVEVDHPAAAAAE